MITSKGFKANTNFIVDIAAQVYSEKFNVKGKINSINNNYFNVIQYFKVMRFTSSGAQTTIGSTSSSQRTTFTTLPGHKL